MAAAARKGASWSVGLVAAGLIELLAIAVQTRDVLRSHAPRSASEAPVLAEESILCGALLKESKGVERSQLGGVW